MFGTAEIWGVWARRWTAEEGRHSIVIRDYLTVTGMVDPVALERARMHQVCTRRGARARRRRSTGSCTSPSRSWPPASPTAPPASCSTTRPATTVMARVGADENLHHLLYRDLVTAALEIDPSAVVEAIERQVTDFEMPGTGIVDFADHALAIAKAGIYDLKVHHEQILVPVVLRHWAIEALEGLTPEAEEARRRLRQAHRPRRPGRSPHGRPLGRGRGPCRPPARPALPGRPATTSHPTSLFACDPPERRFGVSAYFDHLEPEDSSRPNHPL